MAKIKVPTSLYTTEGSVSRKKVEKELQVPDPSLERAEAVLREESKEEDEDAHTK